LNSNQERLSTETQGGRRESRTKTAVTIASRRVCSDGKKASLSPKAGRKEITKSTARWGMMELKFE